MNIGNVRSEGGDSAGALEVFQEVLAASQGQNLPVQRAAAFLGTGQTLARAGLPDKALEALLEAVAIADSNGPHQQRAEIHRVLSGVFEAKGKSDRALYHFKIYHELHDQLRGVEAERRLARVMVSAERRERERETELLRQKADLLERLSREDVLTGLRNRRDFDERACGECERARRFQHPLVVALADIDHFKRINDRHSHATGDAVLRTIAGIMREHTRQSDLVARYGGEEFAMVLVETSIADGRSVCDRIRAAVAAYDWQGIARGMKVTISVGLVEALAYDDVERALAAADAQLYMAKRQGRNRVVSAVRLANPDDRSA
jgi:diguanylate cyclase (GGDEF)-like protein